MPKIGIPVEPAVVRDWDGDLIALFPLEPADEYGDLCGSWMQIGEHGGADYHGVIAQTKPVSKKAAEEFIQFYYRNVGLFPGDEGMPEYKVYNRASWRMHQARRDEARQRREALRAR